jgi:hypothetical protein
VAEQVEVTAVNIAQELVLIGSFSLMAVEVVEPVK